MTLFCQFYRRKLVKGAVFTVLFFLTIFLIYFTPLILTRTGLFLSLAIFLLVSVCILIDSIITAVRQKNTESENYKPVFVVLYIVIIFLGSLILNYYANIPIHTFRVSSESSYPNLKPGDVVAADARQEFKANLTYGDLVVYKYKDTPRIARIAAKQGDSIQFNEPKVMVNGITLENEYIKDTISGNLHYKLYQETTINQQKYHILKTQELGENALNQTSNYFVTKGNYFLLADNRDVSQDSRIIGSINQKDIVGKIVYRVKTK